MAAGLALKGLESRQSGGDEKAAVKVGQTFLSARFDSAPNDRPADRPNCHPEEARPARGSTAGGRPQGTPLQSPGASRQCKGDEKAAVRVGQTFLSAGLAQTERLTNGQTCHPEEAALPASEFSAGMLTKDLLRHRLIHERLLSFAVTWQAARLRLHGHAEEAHAMSAVQRRNHSPLAAESKKPSRSLSLSKGRRWLMRWGVSVPPI